MTRWAVFDITKPLLSDEAERIVQAASAKEAIKKLAGVPKGAHIRQVRGSGRFVVYNPDATKIQKRIFDYTKGY